MYAGKMLPKQVLLIEELGAKLAMPFCGYAVRGKFVVNPVSLRLVGL
jgi:hypothetical protein